MENPYRHIDFKRMFEQFGADFINRQNERQIEQDEKRFSGFKIWSGK